MSTYALLMAVPALALLVCAAAVDIRSRRIPNWVTFTLLCSGLVQSVAFGALTSPGASLLGAFVGLALPFAMFAIGAIGAGDVKLLAGLGAWFGAVAVFQVFCIEAVIGAVIVLSQAVAQGRIRPLFRNTAVLAVNLTHVKDVGLDHVKETGLSSRSVDRPLPYAVPVLLAVLVLLVWNWTPGRV